LEPERETQPGPGPSGEMQLNLVSDNKYRCTGPKVEKVKGKSEDRNCKTATADNRNPPKAGQGQGRDDGVKKSPRSIKGSFRYAQCFGRWSGRFARREKTHSVGFRGEIRSPQGRRAELSTPWGTVNCNKYQRGYQHGNAKA